VQTQVGAALSRECGFAVVGHSHVARADSQGTSQRTIVGHLGKFQLRGIPHHNHRYPKYRPAVRNYCRLKSPVVDAKEGSIATFST